MITQLASAIRAKEVSAADRIGLLSDQVAMHAPAFAPPSHLHPRRHPLDTARHPSTHPPIPTRPPPDPFPCHRTLPPPFALQAALSRAGLLDPGRYLEVLAAYADEDDATVRAGKKTS
jgi:hypothetical protein